MNEKLNCIMVIDDDEPTNFICSMLIEEANCTHHLEVVESGLKALNFLKNATGPESERNHFILPDLIFLDINMPCMNGWEFLDEFKKLKQDHVTMPVIIMLTTSLNPEDKLKAERMTDVAGFENKPLTAEMIKRIIKTHCKSGSIQVIETTNMKPMNGENPSYPPKPTYI